MISRTIIPWCPQDIRDSAYVNIPRGSQIIRIEGSISYDVYYYGDYRGDKYKYDWDHPDLADNIWINEDEIPDNEIDDDNTEGSWNGTIECPYQYIQDGIDLADDGATVYVYSGTYVEELHISKPVILQGENKETTIISGNSIGIFADGVKISGFTIKNSISIYSDDNIISDNIFISADFDDIRLDGSLNNKILDNSFSSNGITIRTSGTPFFKFYNTHTIQNNYINGKPIYYYKNNHQGCVVPSDASQVILVNCSNFTIENLNLANSFYGIQLYYSSHNNIMKNTINNGERYGDGIYLFNSRYNQISENKLSYYHAGISIYKRSNWNVGQKGNYWDDYTGIDSNSDGIGDTPYPILEDGNIDNYPLINPIGI